MTPEYLYKILPFSNWQSSQDKKVLQLTAEDDTFIHLAKEDQLEKIISKFAVNWPQVVILKLKTEKLKGDLREEINPQGSNKYYHLYNGFIPFEAIVEVKNIPNIVSVGYPALRQPAKALTHEEILSAEIQDLIETMKNTMRRAPGVGLAAPQIGKSLQIAVIEDQNHSHLTSEQLLERQREKVPFHVIINPKITFIKEKGKVEFFEGCLSMPGFMGIVPRYREVKVECLNERAEPVTIHAKGWYARILQHEIDHLQGAIYIDRAYLPTIMTEETYNQFWKDLKINQVMNNLIYINKIN